MIKEKWDVEGDGWDFLVVYLSDVGGYDRNYCDVGDEDENSLLGRNVNISKFFFFFKKKSMSDNVLIRGGWIMKWIRRKVKFSCRMECMLWCW